MYPSIKNVCETWPYLQAGNPATTPLILLHGFLGSGEDWLLCAEQLRDSYYCIMPDLPGCGQNVKRSFNEPLHFEQISKELVQFIQRQNINDFVLVGYSMGARVALHATTQNYVTPRALVLESGNPGIEDKSERQKRAGLDQQRSERIRDEGLENFLRDWYSTELFGNIAARPAEFAPLLQKRLQANSAQWAAKVIEDLSPGRMPSLWDALPRINTPTLVMAGELDTVYQKLCRRLAAAIPNARFESVPHSAHSPHMENKEHYCQLLKTFLANSLD